MAQFIFAVLASMIAEVLRPIRREGDGLVEVLGLLVSPFIVIPSASRLIERVRNRPPRTAGPPSSRSTFRKKASRKGAASIFISYRRADSADVTGRIYDRLAERLGQARVVKGVDSIPLGVNFKQYLTDSMDECQLLLVIIGQRWASRENTTIGTNIAHPVDFARIEVETAIQRSLPIIPVLVQGARMPRPTELPDSLEPLAYFNAIEARPDPDFHSDVTRLINGIEKHLN